MTHWLPLHRHLSDAAGVAAKLWDEEFWAPMIRRRLASRYNGDEKTARALAILLAENHDVGKASPAFASQCKELTPAMWEKGLLAREGAAKHPDRAAVRHEVVSYLAFLDWAEQRGGRSDTHRQLASVLGVHHGRPLASERVRLARERPLLLGEDLWATVRREFLDRAAENPEVSPHLDAILATPLRQSDLVLLSGMLMLTDWIASSEAYFPLFELASDPELNEIARINEAWRRFSPQRGWHPDPPTSPEELFRRRFQLPENASIHPAQRELFEAARAAQPSKLMILEAHMGSGKTEAALAAAEVLAARVGANGLFVALPTQATSDGMFARVHDWADRAGAGTSIFLAHGRSALNDEFQELWEDPRFNDIDDSANASETGAITDKGRRRPVNHDGSVFVHRWFAGSKKGPLSNLVVGTIDQLLFTSLQSRHVSLRHLAFAGKVVVIDEAHAFDVYMGEFLNRAVQWLGAYGVPTIILSATLPAERRQDLVRAYEEGRLLDRGERVRSRGRSLIDTSELTGHIGYPAIVTSGVTPELRLPGWNGRDQSIELERIGDGQEDLAALLRERMTDGGCVAIVRNVVKRAQETAEYLRAQFPDTEVVLAHSRFLAEDRARRDRELLARFGPPSRVQQRPKRAIVVATQVIEQSLDLDFDLMVSDLAPIDLLLQRTGRLHRHARAAEERPSTMRSPRLVITGVDWGEDPPEPVRGSRAVYGEHLLLRTLAELEGRTSVTLPADIAPTVQRVYSGEPYDSLAVWQEAFAVAQEKFQGDRVKHRSEADAFRLGEVCRDDGTETLLGWAKFSVGDAENDAQERKGRATVRRTGESIEVFALFSDGSALSVAPWWELGTQGELPLNSRPEQDLVRAVLRSAVRIPEHDCKGYGAETRRSANRECQWSGIDLLIRDLEQMTIADDRLRDLQQAKELRGELMVVFDERGRCELPGAVLHYSERDGLRVEHNGASKNV